MRSGNPHPLPQYQFKPGHKLSLGRPPTKKTALNKIRSRILRVVQRRIFREKMLETVSTTDLLKFLAQIMPKDVGLSVQAPQINYISNIPREDVKIEDQSEAQDEIREVTDDAEKRVAAVTALNEVIEQAENTGDPEDGSTPVEDHSV